MALSKEQQEQRLLLGHEGFYFTGGESLRVTSLNSITGVTVSAAGRFLPVSELRPTDIALSHTPNTDRSAASSDQVMGEGWLQSLTLITSGGSPVVGSTFVRVDVVRGGGASSTVLATLLQGFVTANCRLAWPGALMIDPVSRPGRRRSITGSDPAAGAEISETVPTGARWRLLDFRAAFNADATVANRESHLTIDDGTNILYESGAALLTVASGGAHLQLFRASAAPTNLSTLRPVNGPEEIMLLAGYRIRTETQNFQAGDNYGAPQMLVEEWLEA